MASALLRPQPKIPAPLRNFSPLVYDGLYCYHAITYVLFGSWVECGRCLWSRFVTPLLGGFTSRWGLAYQEAGSR